MKTENKNHYSRNICNDIELLIDEYLEGMIALKDKEIMDVHVSACAKCLAYLSETEILTKNLSSLPVETLNLSIQKKNELWEKVNTGIDSEIKPVREIKITSNENQSVFSKHKYIFSGIAAAIAIAFLVFAVKKIDFKDVQLAQQQNTFGLPTYWKVSSIQGNPLIGDVAMNNIDSIREGQFIRTNDSSRAQLIIANMGNVIIEPNSKIIFIKGVDGNNRISVEYGTIESNMRSNPKTFFVEMPSAIAMDMGGDYKLTIDSTGDGLVYVKSGKVEVQSNNREAIVPAGNLVMTKRDLGVGTPFNENSSPRFKNALMNLDFGKCGGACVNTLLKNAKVSDAITLVSLISRVESQYKDEVYTKVANFVSPPSRIHSDSLPFFDIEKMNKWIDKIQVEVQENIEKNIENMEKSLENMKEFEMLHLDTLKMLEDFSKNWKFKMPKFPEGDLYKYEWDGDSAYFDKKEFEKDMKEFEKDMKEHEFDKEEFKKDMEDLKEELKDMQKDLKDNLNFNNEELKREMEKVKEEIKKAMEEVDKNLKIQIDTSVYRYKSKSKNKDGSKNEEKNDNENEGDEEKGFED